MIDWAVRPAAKMKRTTFNQIHSISSVLNDLIIMTSLGVNIDHVANVREARKTTEPDPVSLAYLALLGGADGITVHLREDRRHIQDRDLKLLRETVNCRLNLEMAATAEMISIASQINPEMITLVPEKRDEVTTEGGLNVISNEICLKNAIDQVRSRNIPVSLFIDPIPEQIEKSFKLGATWIELHTGTYAQTAWDKRLGEIAKLQEATIFARNLGLRVNAGHGLTYQNVEAIASIEGIEELNIGHTIISRALAVGLKEAVKEMKSLIRYPRKEIYV